jgi:hypothetical protein
MPRISAGALIGDASGRCKYQQHSGDCEQASGLFHGFWFYMPTNNNLSIMEFRVIRISLS